MDCCTPYMETPMVFEHIPFIYGELFLMAHVMNK